MMHDHGAQMLLMLRCKCVASSQYLVLDYLSGSCYSSKFVCFALHERGLQVLAARTEFVTQLYFHNDVPRSYEDYVTGRNSQFPTQITKYLSGRRITFNIIMDL